MRPRDPLLSIVVPVLNEWRVLPELRRRVVDASSSWGVRWEVIFVDDGSTDGTSEAIRQIHLSDTRFKAITFSRNFGHQLAVTAGLRRASGDAVAVMDADLQDPPELIAEFLEHWREGYDVVYGVRRKRKEGPVKRLLYASYYRILQYLSEIPIPLDSGDFSLMDHGVVDALNRLPERHRFVRGLRAWVGFRQVGVEYERAARDAGKSNYTLRRLLHLASDGVLSFSSKPLTFISVIGVVTAGLSLLGFVFFVAHRLIGFRVFGYAPSDVPGFTSIIFSVLFIGGVQLFALGVLGKYIALIADEARSRPLYIERELLGFADAGSPEVP